MKWRVMSVNGGALWDSGLDSMVTALPQDITWPVAKITSVIRQFNIQGLWFDQKQIFRWLISLFFYIFSVCFFPKDYCVDLRQEYWSCNCFTIMSQNLPTATPCCNWLEGRSWHFVSFIEFLIEWASLSSVLQKNRSNRRPLPERCVQITLSVFH